MDKRIPVENGDILAALRGFLRQVLESGIVESLFVPLETGDGSIMPALVTDVAILEKANPFLPVMPINNARAVSALTGKRSPGRLGVVLRSCELRALVELVKLQQASLEDVLLIGFDCGGTYNLADFLSTGVSHGYQLAEYLAAVNQGESPSNDLTLRTACQMCVQPVPVQADLYIHLFGVDLKQGLPVSFREGRDQAPQGVEDFLENQLHLEDVKVDGIAQQVAEKIISTRKQVRVRALSEMRTRMQTDGGIASIFASCIRCHNCMTACPICYCKTCLFRSAFFDHPPEMFLKAAQRKGAQRMLGDTLLFHMTRLNHMSASCVSCGMCTAACPSDIPVGTLFSAVGEQVQSAFEYQPGQDVSEPLPLVTFRTDEWIEIGEER